MALNFPAIGLVIGVIWFSIEYLAADYFTELMNQYNIAPNHIHGMFLDSVHQYLAWASAVAILLAVMLSYILSNRVLRPLKEVSVAIHKMSAGDRDAQARSLSNDELGDLANAFNLMASRIKQSEDLRENMVTDLAHELRTPVTNILGYVEGLQDKVLEPNDHNLGVLEKEALRLGNLVESLLDLSRADAAGFNLKIAPMNIQDAISMAIDNHSDGINKKALTINIDTPASVQNILADVEKIQIIISIFLHNACQYSTEGSIIKIWSERKNDEWRLSMANPSETIHPDDLTLIFERFYRTDKSRSRNSGGAGIGLAIVKKLVEAHGGCVGASSHAGVFTVWFSIPDNTNALAIVPLQS